MRRVSPILKVALIIPLGVIVWLSLPAGHPQVARVTKADPELQAASNHAQETLPDFIRQLRAPKPEQGFAVKGGFRTSAGIEYLWVKNPTLKGDIFTGKLDQEPAIARTHHKGDTVSVAKKDVYDWLIHEEGKDQGAFTEQVLSKRAKP